MEAAHVGKCPPYLCREIDECMVYLRTALAESPLPSNPIYLSAHAQAGRHWTAVGLRHRVFAEVGAFFSTIVHWTLGLKVLVGCPEDS